MGPASAVVNFGSSCWFLSFLVFHQRVLSDLINKPVDLESLVNETTYFNCSSSITAKEIDWYHYPVGVEAHQRKTVYAFGKFYKDYQKDFVLEKNSSSGAYNLVIQSVKPGYAGQYECQEDGGSGSSSHAQLIVLDDDPECNSNINPYGVIGPNACEIQPDELHLSCSVSYHGNIPPELKWIKLGENDDISENVTKSANRITCNLTVKADLLTDKSSYKCQITKSRTSKHSCTSETIRLLYIFSASSVSVKNIGEVVNCSANTSSQSCQYKWKWYDIEDLLTVSDNQTLKVENMGMHRCEATCNLRDKQCTVNATLICATQNSSSTVSENKDVNGSTSISLVVGLVVGVLLVVIIVIVMIVLWIRCRRQPVHKDKHAMESRLEQFTEEGHSLLPIDQIAGAVEEEPGEREYNFVVLSDNVAEETDDEEHPGAVEEEPGEREYNFVVLSDNVAEETDDEEHPGKRKKAGSKPIDKEFIAYDLHPELLHVESFNRGSDEKTVINGLTVLDKELFIVFENKSKVKVFQAIKFSRLRSFSVMDLNNPLDIVSSPADSALYISSPNKIYRVDAYGKIIANWPIEDGGGTLSLTRDQTIVLSDWKRTTLREYSADGHSICEVKLPSDVHPFHAVKTKVDQFVVSYEHGMEHKVHKVAKFDANGTIIQSFSGMLKFPKYLVVDIDGYIFVADQKNSRVLVNSTLKSSKVLLSDKDKLGRPSRICLDVENSQMFVADNKADNLKFMAFKLEKHKTDATAVNQDMPLAINPKEDSGGILDNSVVISDISGNEEDEFHDASETVEESRGEKRKR